VGLGVDPEQAVFMSTPRSDREALRLRRPRIPNPDTSEGDSEDS